MQVGIVAGGGPTQEAHGACGAARILHVREIDCENTRARPGMCTCMHRPTHACVPRAIWRATHRDDVVGGVANDPSHPPDCGKGHLPGLETTYNAENPAPCLIILHAEHCTQHTPYCCAASMMTRLAWAEGSQGELCLVTAMNPWQLHVGRQTHTAALSAGARPCAVLLASRSIVLWSVARTTLPK